VHPRVSESGTTVAEFPTMGYLLDVFFSPDNAMLRSTTVVEIPVIILGHLTARRSVNPKMPDDVAEDLGRKEAGRLAGPLVGRIVPEILALCPTCTNDDYVILSCSLPAGKAQTN